jgi:hypothetical protein
MGRTVVDPLNILLLVFIYAAAGFVQGLTGFAFALIAVPFTALLGGVREAVGIVAFTATVIVLYSGFLHRRHFRLRRVLPLALAGMALIPPGILFLINLPEKTVMISLGGVVIGLTLFSRISGAVGQSLLAHPAVGYAFAALSGLLGGAFSTPGPTIVAYMYAADESPLRAKADIQLYFSLVSTAICVAHAVTGTMTPAIMLKGIPLVPLALLGTKAGVAFSERLPVKALRLVTDLSLIALGAFIIVSRLG